MKTLYIAAFLAALAMSPVLAADNAGVNDVYERYVSKESDYFSGIATMEETVDRKREDYTPDLIWVPPFKAPALISREALLKEFDQQTRPLKEAQGGSVELKVRVAARRWLGANNAIDLAYAKSTLFRKDKEPRSIYLTLLIVSHRNPNGTWSWQAGSSSQQTPPESYEEAKRVPGLKFDN